MSGRGDVDGAGHAALTVATYNLYLGADLTVVFDVGSQEELTLRAGRVLDQVAATDFPARAGLIARSLVENRVDVVGLQEVARWSSAGDGAGPQVWLDFCVVLLEALRREGETYDAHACTPSFHGGAVVGTTHTSVLGHNVILVRRGSGVRVTGERVGGFGDRLQITTGTPDVVFEIERGWSAIDAEIDGTPFRFVNTHHEAWDERTRDAQRDELVDALAAGSGPVVVVGDFNATPEQVGMPVEYVDAWTVADAGEGHTCGRPADLRGGQLRHRIDYVWVRGARVERCWVVGGDEDDRTATGLWPSDHACVVARVRL
jgi:endonuclease/exonuclease/phosphatase family metal-dependent hydrolase